MDEPNGYPGKWTLYIPNYHSVSPEGEYKLPDYLYYRIPGNSSIQFDYLGWNKKAKIVSERMLIFLKEHGITEGYEIATVEKIFNRSGKEIVAQHQYYILRFYQFDDALMNFHPETGVDAIIGKGKFKIYPNMKIKSGVKKEIFILDEFVYRDSLIFTENIKKEIIDKKFIGPEIYSMNEFYIAYNGSSNG